MQPIPKSAILQRDGPGLWTLNVFLPLTHIHLFLTGVVVYELRSGFQWRFPGMLMLCLVTVTQGSWQHTWMVVNLAAFLFIAARYRIPFLASSLLISPGLISCPLSLIHQNIGYVIIQFGYSQGWHGDSSILAAACVAGRAGMVPD